MPFAPGWFAKITSLWARPGISKFRRVIIPSVRCKIKVDNSDDKIDNKPLRIRSPAMRSDMVVQRKDSEQGGHFDSAGQS